MIDTRDPSRLSSAAIIENYNRVVARVDLHGGLGRTKIIAVSKTWPASVVQDAASMGIVDFGENYAKELSQKALHLRDNNVQWHMIGSLQSRTIASIASFVDLWHSVSRRKEIEILGSLKLKSKILLQVNLSAGDSRNGLGIAEIEAHLDFARSQGLTVIGLMTVLPQLEMGERRVLFRRLYQTGESLGLNEFSMGMTDDFECAVEEGSTMVRVGRAIFGDRMPK